MPERFGPTYLESFAEIVRRFQTGKPTPRTTSYKGIEFRSRLEARFARHLDAIGEAWVYEPRIYGRKGRGYLPDFELLNQSDRVFVEVKPTLAEVPAAKARAAVIWETHPKAVLLIAVEEGRTFYVGERGLWDSWQERWAA